MADHHIYIHSDTVSEGGKATKPWGESKESPSTSFEDLAGGVAERINLAGNPDQLVGIAGKKITSFAPAAAAVLGVAIAAYHLTMKVHGIIGQFEQIEGGATDRLIAIANERATLGLLLKPFSTALTTITAEESYRVANSRQEQYRSLVGDSFVNDLGRGKGV